MAGSLPRLSFAWQRTDLPSPRGTVAPEPRVVVESSFFRDVRPEAQVAVSRALAVVPQQDKALLVDHDINVHLIPKATIDDGLWGATSIERASVNHPWVPTKIRIATEQADAGVVALHEIGHAVSVLRTGDRSEEAADRYMHALRPAYERAAQ